MNIKVDFDNIVVKEDKNDFKVKVLMLKGEKGDAGAGEDNVIETVQVNGIALPVSNKTVDISVPTVDSSLSSSSTNPVQNKVIHEALSNKVDNTSLDNYYETSEIDDLLSEKADDLSLTNEITARANADTDLANEIAVERARIDGLATLEEGSTTGDAELIDIRTGYNSITYSSAGNSVRGQASSLKSEIDYANEGLATFNKALFVAGHLQQDGVVTTSGNNKRRCASNTIFEFDYPITIHIASGFKIGLDYYNVGDDSRVVRAETNLTGDKPIPANTRFKIEIHRVTEDYSEIADVNTFVNQAPFTSKAINYIDNKIAPLYFVPELRNGSIGSGENTNAIATKYILPTNGAKKVLIKSNLVLEEGHYFAWLLSTFTQSGGYSYSATYKIYDYPYKYSYNNYITYDVEGAKGFAIGLFEYDEDGEYVAHRIANDGNAFTVYYLEENNLAYKDLRNGSLSNTGSSYAVSFYTTETIPKGFNVAEVWIDAPNIEDVYYNVDLWGYSQEKCLSSAIASRTEYIDRYIKNSNNHFTIYLDDISKDAKSFAIGIWAYNKSDNSQHALRIADFKNVKILYSSLPSSILKTRVSGAYVRNQDKDIMLAAATRYNKIGNNSKDFCILQITDSHNDDIAERNAIAIANGFQYIDTLIHTGDFCADKATNFKSSIYNEFINGDKPFYFVCGNHDVGNRKTIADCIDNATFYTRYIAPLVTKGLLVTGEYENGKGYYYHDFVSQKIRLICVYEADDPNDINQNDITQYIIQRGASVISQDQAEWFCETLNSTPSEYSVIVAMHNPFSPKADCVTTAKFNQPNWVNGYGSQRLFSTDLWADAVNSYVNRSTYTCDMVCTGDASYLNTNNGKYYSFTYDFSNATGSFLCFIGGHVHQDCVWQHQTYTYQKQITPVCANTINYAQCPSADIRRTVDDTPAKDSLTAIGCDTTNKKLRLVKIGVNVTENMEYRDFEIIDCN